jgi:hypothetical protein
MSRDTVAHKRSATYIIQAMKRGQTTGPNGRCQICRHPERARLEHLFARGASRNAVGLKFGVSPDAVVRHWAKHVPPHVKAAASAHALRPGVELEKLVMDESIGLLDHLQRIRSTLYVRFDASAEAGDSGTVAILARALHENLKISAAKTGELQQHAKTNVTNIVLSADYLALRAGLLSALRGFPEAAQAVSLAFRRVEDRSGLTGAQNGPVTIEHEHAA